MLLDEAQRGGLFVESSPPGAALHLGEDPHGAPEIAAGWDTKMELMGWLLMRSAVSSTAAGDVPNAPPPFRVPFTISRFLLRMLLRPTSANEQPSVDAFEHAEVDPQSALFVADGIRDPASNVRGISMQFLNGGVVTAANVHAWASETRTHALLTRRQRGIEALRRGFRRHESLARLVSDLVGHSSDVLQQLLCQSYLSAREITGLTQFRNFPADSPVPGWMRRLLLDMSQETLRKWLRWSTGAYTVKSVTIFFQRLPDPRGGGGQPLPTAHTCFNSVDVFAYPTEEVLREKLLMAIEETSMGTR